MMRKILLLNFLVLLFPFLGTAQSNDATFSINSGFNNLVLTIVLQSDGKILVGGDFTEFNGNPVNRIARLNSDGTIDNSFTIGTGFNSGGVWSIALQSDGKILAGGSFTSYNGSSANRIVRLNTDGTLDNSFTIGGGFYDQVLSIALQTDGKILVGGEFTSFNVSSANKIVRLNTDGTFDNSFTVGTGFNNYVASIAVQPDGKILAVGEFNSFNGSFVKKIARLNADGTIDNSFTIGSGFNYGVNSVALQTDGKILACGWFTSFNGSPSSRLARLNSDGTIDNSFTIGTGFNNSVWSVSVQTNGEILAGGKFTSFNGSPANRIARLNSNGTVDNSFTTGTGFDDEIFSIILQPDEKILVGGKFSEFNGIVRNRVVRLTNCIASTNVFTHSSCDPYTWINGVNYTASNNSAIHTIVGGAISGCDSIVTLNLTITSPLMGTDVISSCDSYTWINGVEYTTSNNTAIHTIIGGAISGCDSIVTLNLTITAINTAVTQANDVLTSQETGATYQWINCSDNSPIAGATNVSFTATSNGSYAVKVTKSGCTETSTCYSVTAVGVENVSATSYKLYPNPVTDVLTIESQGNVQQVTLYSITGQLLQTITPQSNVIEVDVAPYESGIYIVKIQNIDGNSTTNRVVKK